MTKDTLIELIRELKEHNLVPSKKKSQILANLSDKQVRLFLDFKENGFITQSNLNYAIEMVSKIEVTGRINTEALSNLWYPNIPDVPQKVFQFMLHDLKGNFNIGCTNIERLSDIVDTITLGCCDSIKYIIETLDNKELIDANLTEPILAVYSEIASEPLTYDVANEKIYKLESVIKNKDILKAFTIETSSQERRMGYYNMLLSFSSLIDSNSNEKLEIAENLVSDFAKKNQLDVQDISILLDSIGSINNLDYIPYFKRILEISGSYGKSNLIVTILNNFEQRVENRANLVDLTETIYDLLMKKYNFSKELADYFYSDILASISSYGKDLEMENISDFVINLIDSDFIDYYERNYHSMGFVNCAFMSGADYLDNFNAIAVKPNEMSEETYDNIINSFSPYDEDFSIKYKSEIYVNNKVLEVIAEKPRVLRVLNKILDDTHSFISTAEVELFQNPEFLRSEFFQYQYYYLVHCSGANELLKSVAYHSALARVISTLDFNDSDLLFYVQSLLTIKDSFTLESIYQERLQSAEAGFETVGNSIYDILSSGSKEDVDNYIEIFSLANGLYDFKADSKIIYQKKLGKKND